MYSIDDPDEMSPAERFQEVAWILAAGFSRLGKRDSFSASIDSYKPDKSDHPKPLNASERLDNAGIDATGLDFPNPWSHCSNGVNSTEYLT